MDKEIEELTQEPNSPTAHHGWPGLLSKELAQQYLGMTADEFNELDIAGCIPFKRLMRKATSKLAARYSEKRYRRLDLDQWSQTVEGCTVAESIKNYQSHLRRAAESPQKER